MSRSKPPAIFKRDIPENRKLARQNFAGLLHEFLDGVSRKRGSLAESWASLWDVSTTQVFRWANRQLWKSSITAGEIQALPPRDRLELLRFWVQRTDEELNPPAPAVDPTRDALAAGVLAGRIAFGEGTEPEPSTVRAAVDHARATLTPRAA